MAKWLLLFCIGLTTLAGCASSSGSVVDNVLQDFGLRNRPEGYESGSDRALARLHDVGKGEIRRLNLLGRRGEIKFEEGSGFQGKYYKETKVYEAYYPLDARPMARTSNNRRGYLGYVEYAYRIYQSARKNSRGEAETAIADIPAGGTSRETYRYRLNSAAVWDGGEGERVRR